MKNIPSIIIALCLMQSCINRPDSEMIIKGSGLDTTIKKVYLTSALYWDKFLDSAECSNGKFLLNFKNKEQFEPFLASLCYLNKNRKITQLYVRNDILIKKTGKNSSNSGFMFDFGTTLISNHTRKYGVDLVDMAAGNENELFKKLDWQNFGYIYNKTDRKLKGIINTIDQNPDSYYLINKINQYREQYDKPTLSKVLSLFSKRIKNSSSGRELKEYIDNIPEANATPESLSLLSSDGTRKENINKTSELNMLVFWASWCGPCRLEIPDLIKLESVYQNKRFYMASISIDQNPSLWHKAIVEDKPTWDQFLVEKQDITKIMARYKFSSIPLVVFTDKNGKELIRFSGYRPNQFTDYIKIIKKFSTQD